VNKKCDLLAYLKSGHRKILQFVLPLWATVGKCMEISPPFITFDL